ncbi:MAG: hypothetical protein GX051_07150 [Clostridiales bacterium]|nr:hypothetical protein [Clostridiales bacterium]
MPLKNTVASLAWSASRFSLFFHLTTMPFSAAGSGMVVRPAPPALEFELYL